MDVSYFIIDEWGQLRQTPREHVEQLWEGECSADDLGLPLDDELRLITVLRDERLMPLVSYFVKVELEEGEITEESRSDAYEAVSQPEENRYDHPATQEQMSGWPMDWPHQLAVALDVPVAELRKVGIGGPLILADLWGVPLAVVLEYFEQAMDP